MRAKRRRSRGPSKRDRAEVASGRGSSADRREVAKIGRRKRRRK